MANNKTAPPISSGALLFRAGTALSRVSSNTGTYAAATGGVDGAAFAGAERGTSG